MSRELVAYVHVAGRVFAPGDDVPDEYAEKITNPAAWGGEVSAKVSDDDGLVRQPPRAGKGSGREAWASFAKQHGHAVRDDATRDDIIAEMESYGVVEPGE